MIQIQIQLPTKQLQPRQRRGVGVGVERKLGRRMATMSTTTTTSAAVAAAALLYVGCSFTTTTTTAFGLTSTTLSSSGKRSSPFTTRQPPLSPLYVIPSSSSSSSSSPASNNKINNMNSHHPNNNHHHGQRRRKGTKSSHSPFRVYVPSNTTTSTGSSASSSSFALAVSSSAAVAADAVNTFTTDEDCCLTDATIDDASSLSSSSSTSSWIVANLQEQFNDWQQTEQQLLQQQQQELQQVILSPNPFDATAASLNSIPYLSPDTTMDTDSLISSTTTTSTTTALSVPATVASKETEHNMARLLLVGAAALYGTNFALVKIMGESDLPIGLSSSLRFALAVIATLPMYLTPPKDLAPAHTNGNTIWDKLPVRVGATLAGIEVGLYNAVGYVAQAVGLETTLASKSAFLCSLAVVTVPLLDWLFKGKLLKGRQVTGTFMALAGVAILELGADLFTPHAAGAAAALSASSSWTFQDACSYVQPLMFGLGFWRMEAAMRRYPHEASRTTAGQLLAVFMGSLVYCLVTECGLLPHQEAAFTWNQLQSWIVDSNLLLSLFWTGCISTALTIYMETVALKTLSAAETTLIFSTEPLWGAAFAAVVIGEQFGLDSCLGALLIVSGCVVSNLGVAGIAQFLSSLTTTKTKTSTTTNDESITATTTTTTTTSPK